MCVMCAFGKPPRDMHHTRCNLNSKQKNYITCDSGCSMDNTGVNSITH